MMIVTTPLKYDDDSGTAAAAARRQQGSSRRYAKYSMAARSDDKARVVCDGGMQTLKDHARTKLLA